MTKKDFILIEDCIATAVENFLQICKDSRVLPDPTLAVQRQLRLELAKAFADKLRYTNDSFDPNRFRDSVINVKIPCP